MSKQSYDKSGTIKTQKNMQTLKFSWTYIQIPFYEDPPTKKKAMQIFRLQNIFVLWYFKSCFIPLKKVLYYYPSSTYFLFKKKKKKLYINGVNS